MRLAFALSTLLTLSACTRDAAPPATEAADTPPPASVPAPAPAPAPPPVTTPPPSAPSFVDIAWRADAGSGVEVGTRYTFQGDGTLLVDSPNGTPMRGTWRLVDGALTMVEEGIEYPTDIVEQSADRLHLRSNNPGGAVELLLVRDVAP